MEGVSTTGGKGIQFHVGCLHLWDAERYVPVILPRASDDAASASSSPRTLTGEVRKVEARTGHGTIDALHRGCWLPNPDGIGQEASGAASVTNSSVFVLR